MASSGQYERPKSCLNAVPLRSRSSCFPHLSSSSIFAPRPGSMECLFDSSSAPVLTKWSVWAAVRFVEPCNLLALRNLLQTAETALEWAAPLSSCLTRMPCVFLGLES